MLRITGICLIIAGAALFIFSLLSGRRKGIRADMKELSMIVSSGYVSERVADEKKASPFEGQVPIMPAPKKKRVLSEEARGILEMVERGREKEAAEKEVSVAQTSREEPKASNQQNKGTAILSEPQNKGTAVLPKEGKDAVPAKKGTAVLPSGGAAEKKGTAVLLEDISVNTLQEQKKGTAVLPEALPTETVPRDIAETPNFKKGTAVLIENAKKGTAVLIDNEEGRSRGTAVLPEAGRMYEEDIRKARKGTAVLIEKGGKTDG